MNPPGHRPGAPAQSFAKSSFDLADDYYSSQQDNAMSLITVRLAQRPAATAHRKANSASQSRPLGCVPRGALAKRPGP